MDPKAKPAAGTNFSPAKFISNVVMRTPVQHSAAHDVDTWFTPVMSPRVVERDLDDAGDGELSIDELVKKLKSINGDIQAHHLTSVIAGMPSQQVFTLKPEDFKPTMPTVIAPVSIKDFQDFLSTTRGRTEKLFGKRKRPDTLPRGRTGSSSGISDGTRQSIFDFRQPLEQWQEEAMLNPVETLQQCYDTVPEPFFNSKFDPITDSPEVISLVDRTNELRQPRDEYNSYNGYDSENLEVEITRFKDEYSERLSEQLDLVEKCLFTQTTTRADTIFQTVTNLHSLQSMVALESGRVVGLRQHIADLRAVTTTGRAQVLSLQRKRTNSAALWKTLEAIRNVSLARPAMDRLLSSGDYTGAFSVLEQALQILDGELNGVVALRTLARQFREMKEVIGGEMAETFVRQASDRLDSGQSGGVATPVAQLQQPIIQEETLKFRASLGPLVRGMIRKGNLRDALARHRVRLLELIKNTAKLVVAQTLETVPQDKRSDALREMDTVHFVSFLRATFEGLEIILNRAEVVHNAVIASLPSPNLPTPSANPRSARRQTTYVLNTPNAAKDANQPVAGGPSLSIEETKELTAASAAVVLKVRESAQQVVIRLLTFRDEQHSALSLSEFKLIYDAIQDFIASSGEPALELRQAIGKQCDALLNSLDDKNVSALRQVLDAETWEMQNAVPRDVQSMVTRLESGKVLVNDVPMEEGIRGGVTGEAETARRHLIVGNRNLKITGASLSMIRFLHEYVRCALMFPQVAYRTATKAFDLLILYDERIRRLILGAEVKQKGRLATIGSKHLAMASQSLSALYLLLNPLCKIFVDTVPPQQQARVEDDLLKRVEKTMHDHINAIGDTLVSLINNEIVKLGNNIKAVNWDGAGTKGLDKAQPYMTDFEEKVNKLHNVLSANLDKTSLEDVFQGVKPNGFEGVFSVINRRVPEFFQDVNPTTPAGRMRIRVDISSLVSSLRRLKGQAGPGFGPGTALEDWVNSRYGRDT